MTDKKYNRTCVSAYWNVKNKHDNSYYNWFNNTLKIDCPYVFFSDKIYLVSLKKMSIFSLLLLLILAFSLFI